MAATSMIFNLYVYPEMSMTLSVMQIGFAGFPLGMCFIARDIWLRIQLRKQIGGVICDSCSYSLVGVRIDQLEDGTESVRCPECGNRHAIDGWRLVREDIDPQLTPSAPAGD
jgi:DNA-directed RNA polymerase subunit RPC12/RpoP